MVLQGQRQGSGWGDGKRGRGVLGGECQGLLTRFGHRHTSAHRVYLVWAQEGSELLTVGTFKGEQRGAEQRSLLAWKKRRMGNV